MSFSNVIKNKYKNVDCMELTEIQTKKLLKTKISVSSGLNTCLHCPLKFYFHYVMGLFRYEPSVATQKGTIAHFILENMNKMSLDEIEHIMHCINCDELLTCNKWSNFKKCSKQKANANSNKMLKNIKSFYEVFYRRLDNIQTEKTYYKKYPLKMVAKIDLIAEKDGKKIVLDYKTGKRNTKYIWKYLYQLWFYNEVLKENGIDADNFYLFWVDSNKLDCFEKRDLYLPQFKQKFEEIFYILKNRKFGVKAKNKALCNYCSYKKECEEYKIK